MSISSQYEEEKQKAQERSVAIKILDMMKPLRNSNSKNKARRWVWELLQNAKDVCIDKVKIKIDFNEKEGILKFYHTGKPFDVQSITFLIEQVSTKQRDSAKAETTGKFGTGFLTTHLLSEIVNVDSVIYDESNNLRRFSITLDRSGRSIEEIIASIEKSAKQLAMADNNEIIANYNSDEFNTCFTYRLNSSGIEVAKQGLEDLKICLPYVMIFLNKVDSIYLTHNDTLYSIDNKYDYDCIEYYEFLTQTREEVNKSTYISIKNNNVQIALPININSNSLIKIDEKCPRIFCDFPLIGTENFPFPAIVQSRFFNPTEPRDSIYLSQSDESEVVQNVDLMQQALSLFGNMCDFLSEKKIDKLCYLFDINRKYVDENVDAYWLDTELIDKLNDKLLHADLIKLTNGSFTAIVDIWDNAQVYFPHNTKKEIRKGLWELYYSINPESLPQIQDVEDWYKFSFNDFPKLNFERMFSFLGQNEAADDLVETLNAESIKDVISWLNCFLDIAFKDGDAWRSIKENEYAVLLNQKKQLAYWAKLKEDRIENGILKDIVEECGYDIKEELMSRDIILQDSELNGEVSDDDLVEIIDETLSDNQFSDKLLVAKKVISLYNDDNKAKLQSLSGFYEKLFGKIGERTRVNLNGNKLWHEAEKILIEEIVQEITSAGLVELLKDNYEFSSYEETILWIDKLIYFLEENYDTVARKTIAILPNQNGEFCTKDDILLDDGEIDEELKDIAKLVGEDVRELLLDKRVYLQMSEKSTMTEQYVCDKIRTKVEECVQTCNRVDMPWDAFDKLIVWFNNNGSKAKKMFGALYDNKHKLYDDNKIAENIEKAEEIDAILTEFKIDDIKQLKVLLQSNRGYEGSENEQNWTKEAIANLGITSLEEFEEFIQNRGGANQFDHTPKPDYEMFKFAQQLISRAKKNVISYLKNLPEYNCEDLEELSTTILGGIKKNGQEISIVVRPSDYGEVLIHYSAESDMLMYGVSELWIEDGKSRPRQLTLGEILKNTGIKRIPVR